MNRNTESHFSKAPIVDIPRSKFDRSFTHKTTFDAAELVPCYWADVMPGDTVSMKTSEIVRMTTPLTPVMDNAWLDIYFFFVPNRIINNTWINFMGENTNGPWVEEHEYHIPQTKSPRLWEDNDVGGNCGWKAGSLANYLGCPMNPYTENIDPLDPDDPDLWKLMTYEVQSHPFRAYCLIWNEWFRSTALQTPCYITMDDSDTNGCNYDYRQYQMDKSIGENWDKEYVKFAETGAKCLPVCKPFDYFTSCLPEPQFGNETQIPFNIGENGKAPIKIGLNKDYGEKTYMSGNSPIKIDFQDALTDPNLGYFKAKSSTGTNLNVETIGIFTDQNNVTKPSELLNISGIGNLEGVYNEYYVDLSNAVGATVTQIRQAFAIQRFYERVASGGQRYIEQIYSHYHVTNPDYRFQRPEYLGGKRVPISMSQVIQTSETENTPLGEVGGWSVTSDSNADMFTHSFTEHGILMGVMCVRNQLSYQQGLNRMWSRKNLFDYYFPEFANISAQPVFNKELCLTGNESDEEVFGYNEAWAFERYMPDLITGELNSVYSQSLDIWHYGDFYEWQENLDPDSGLRHAPYLDEKWILADKSNIMRTLAVQNHNQFKADMYFNAIWTRPMPLYSIPGLVDHH